MLVSLATLFVFIAQWDVVKSAPPPCAGSSPVSTFGFSLGQNIDCSDVVGPAFGFQVFDNGPLVSLGYFKFIDGDGNPQVGSNAPNGYIDAEPERPDGDIGGAVGTSTAADTVGDVSMDFADGTLKTCYCTVNALCPTPTPPPGVCPPGSFAIKKSTGAFSCLKFAAPLPFDSDLGTNLKLTSLTGPVTVTIDGNTVVYNFGGVATANGGTVLLGLVLGKTGTDHGVFFSACGPFHVQVPGARKRAPVLSMFTALGSAPIMASSAIGDPHLAGANGIKLDVYGKPAANYSLVIAPSFQVNMQLADRGPDLRFMKKLTVLYRGTSFTIVPWTVKTQRDALVAHFEALGAKVTFDIAKLRIIIEICAGHTIEIVSSHTDIPFAISYLDFAMTVPGCHNKYGGLLGQTYQCKYATEKFEWSRAREEAFRLPTLETPSGSYSATTSCANENEYRGEVIRSSSVGGGNSTLEMTATHQERRRRL